MIKSSEFLDIARMDLQASKVLYENGLYPQAIFYFQQTVEKTTKAFALITGQKITEREFINDIRHDAINIYDKSICHQKKEYEQLKENLNKLPELKTISIFKNFNIDKNIRQLEISLVEINKIKKEKKELIYISSWEIRRILKEIASINKEFEKSKQYFSKFKITDRDWNRMKKEMSEIYNIFSKYDPVQFEETKNNLESSDMRLAVEKHIKSLIVPMNIIPIFISLYYLAIITLPHASTTRYPLNDLNPIKVYTKNLPIIKKLSELIEVQDNVLNELNIFNKKLSDINAKIH